MNRFNAVHNLAKRKIRQLGLIPPIDIEAVIQALNIEIIEERNQLGIEAYSELGDNPRIVINPEMTYYRQRRNFTLAHELGHIFIPWHNGDIKCNFEDNYIKVSGKRLLDTQELEANIFASDFLMPQEWLISEIDNNKDISFDKLVTLIASKANTSIMACFYALEQVMPSGYTYFVKRETSEWWSFFTTHNTYTVNWFSYNEDKMYFFDNLSTKKEVFRIGPYDIVLYKMIPCPSQDELRNELEKNGGSIEALIDSFTKGYRIRILPFLDVVLDVIAEKNYIAYLFQNNNLIRSFFSEKTPLCRIYGAKGYDTIYEIVKSYGFEFQRVVLENEMILLYISEKVFEMPQYPYSEPNLLLHQICDNYGYDKRMLQSINGVMAAANSMHGKDCTDEELYNWCKYKFITDPYYEEVVNDSDFDKYMVNKIISMRLKRKRKAN